MNSGLINKTTLYNIADAIRVKRHSDYLIYPQDMANEITKIDNVSKEGSYMGSEAIYSDALTLGWLRGDNVNYIPTGSQTRPVNTAIYSDRNNSLVIQQYGNSRELYSNANFIYMPKYASRMYADLNKMANNYILPAPGATPSAYYEADYSKTTNLCGFCYNSQMRIHNITIPDNVVDMSFAYCNCHFIDIYPKGFNELLYSEGDERSNWVFCNYNYENNYYYSVEPSNGKVYNFGNNYTALQQSNGYKKDMKCWMRYSPLAGWSYITEPEAHLGNEGYYTFNKNDINIRRLGFNNTQVRLPCGDNVINMAYAYAHTNPFYYNKESLDNGALFASATDYYREGAPHFLYKASCGNNVINMSHAYYDSSLTLTFSNKLTPSGHFAGKIYYNRGLVGSAACGPKVENLSYAYAKCNGLTGTPNCGPNVIDASHAFEWCENLSEMGNAFLGNNVQNAAYMYYGSGLAGVAGDIYFNWNSPNEDNSSTLVDAAHFIFRFRDFPERLNIHFKANSAWHNWFNDRDRAYSFLSHAGDDYYPDEGHRASDFSLIQSPWNNCFYFNDNAFNVYFYYDI